MHLNNREELFKFGTSKIETNPKILIAGASTRITFIIAIIIDAKVAKIKVRLLAFEIIGILNYNTFFDHNSSRLYDSSLF